MSKIFDEIQNAKNVRQYFAQYLDKTFKGSIGVENFKALHEVQQIGITHHFITKLNIIILVDETIYEIYFNPIVCENEIMYKDIMSQVKMDILSPGTYNNGPEEGEYNNKFYITLKNYEGSIFVGFREALIETIKYLNNTQWLKHHHPQI